MIIVVGAGAAGLATAYYLQQRGLDYCVLEKDTVGATWLQHYDRLHLHTLKEVSALPGLPMPADYPRFPSAPQVQAYLQQYARHFRLNIREGVRVQRADYGPAGWHLQTSQGALSADTLIVTTGIWSTPVEPELPGREQFGGQIIHASAYRNPQPFHGQRVLVVGAGNSGAEIAAELGEQGIETGIAIRSGTAFVPHPRSPLAMRVIAWFFRHVPPRIGGPLLAAARRTFDHIGIPTHPDAPLGVYPVVGYALPEAVQAGRVQVYPGLAGFAPGRACFDDGQQVPFDAVILATGYRPTVQFVQHELAFDAQGQPRLDEAGRSTRNPHLYCVGFWYPITEGWLQAIGRVARQTVEALPAQTRQPAQRAA
jgi:putative flavoprotein involved in K+ transport